MVIWTSLLTKPTSPAVYRLRLKLVSLPRKAEESHP